MKKLSISMLALIAAIIALPSVAQADSTPGWYSGAGVGASFGVDPRVHSALGRFKLKDEAPGLAGQISGGYEYKSGIRAELEYFHDQNNMDGAKGFANAGGHITNNIAFLNGLYDFNNGSMYTPYVGAGVGVDFVRVKSVGATGAGFLNGDTTKAAYQGIAGLSAQLDPNWSVNADYRYVASFDPKVDNSVGGRARIDNISHNIMVGVRYSYGAPEPMMAAAPVLTTKAPMVVPHTVGKPTTSATAQNFQVFFDFNKSTLTPEAKRIIASAAQAFQKGHYVKIAVTGHTDTVGTDKYNQSLSDRRATAVEEELKKLGVTGDSVSEAGVGKNGLLVPTADGVREAQNRRAEIILSK